MAAIHESLSGQEKPNVPIDSTHCMDLWDFERARISPLAELQRDCGKIYPITSLLLDPWTSDVLRHRYGADTHRTCCCSMCSCGSFPNTTLVKLEPLFWPHQPCGDRFPQVSLVHVCHDFHSTPYPNPNDEEFWTFGRISWPQRMIYFSLCLPRGFWWVFWWAQGRFFPWYIKLKFRFSRFWHLAGPPWGLGVKIWGQAWNSMIAYVHILCKLLGGAKRFIQLG